MTNRHVTALTICLLSAAAAHADRNDWYDTPAKVMPGVCVIDVADECPASAMIHVRAASDTSSDTNWGIIWNCTDSANYLSAIVTLPGEDRYGSVYYSYPSIRVVSVRDGEATVLYRSDKLDGFDTSGDFNSLRLVGTDTCVTLTGGSNEPVEICHLPYGIAIGEMAIYSDTEIRCQRISTNITPKVIRPRSRYMTSEAAIAAISGTKDPMEGVWEYLDRNTDADKATVGGQYRLLTVGTAEGYDIIYLSGAAVNPTLWQPMDIKGRLRRTIFKGNYDMEWYTADGTLINEDTNAQLSEDGATLTLRFPTIGAEIRLRRMVIR